MPNEPRREHKVPKCYLENFTFDDKKRKINVMWKGAEHQPLINQNICKHACEHDFYRVDFNAVFSRLSEDDKMALIEKLGCVETPEFVFEKWFALFVDSNLSTFINQISSRIHVLCNGAKCIDFFSKQRLSSHMAFQALRTDKLRDIIINIANDYVTDNYPLFRVWGKKMQSKQNIQHTHIMQIFNLKNPTAHDFLNNYYWVLYYNLTHLPFFTSDEPVVRNIRDSHYKVLYPLTPKLLIALLPLDIACGFSDGTVSLIKEVISDGTLIMLKDIDEVARINAYQFCNCKRHVYSNIDVNEIKRVVPNSPLIKVITTK